MNIFLVNSKYGIIIIDFFEVSFFQMILFYFIVQDFKNFMIFYYFPTYTAIFFRKIRILFLKNYICYSSQSNMYKILSEFKNIKSSKSFWKYYHILVSCSDSNSFKFKFLNFLFKNSLRIDS